MGRLKILVSDRTKSAGRRARGELFKSLITQILNKDGYHVTVLRQEESHLLELDIEGKHVETGFPYYAVCRYSETPVSQRDLQAFYGKYMVRWQKDNRCRGLFFVLPGLDEAAGTFFREFIQNNDHTAAFLYEENDLLKKISQIPGNIGLERLARRLPQDEGKTGESILLYTERGIFWAWPITSRGKTTSDKITFFDAKGAPISDRSAIAFLVKLYPELSEFDVISKEKAVLLQPGLFPDADPVVEVGGSAKCFEYQSPASPKHFVGRKFFFDKLDAFTHQVLYHRTKDRGIVIEAPLGWGKSSMVLASVAHVQKKGHFAVAVDCRTASSSSFVPRVVEHTVQKSGILDERIRSEDQKKSTPAFNDAVRLILDAGQLFESQDKLMFIFFDQFEHVFFMPDVHRQIKDLFLNIFEKQTNIVLGFSWDKALIFSERAFSDFGFDPVIENCRQLILPVFSRAEIDGLLKRLIKELDEPLTKELRSFLHRFSQGYPWLLKMLCYHVKIARHSGIPQPAVPGILLGIEELFRQEFQHLSDAERNTLHQIAESAPGRLSTTADTADSREIQHLARWGLIKNVGTAVDISWNLLKFYLNEGRLPFRDHFLFNTGIEQVVDALKILYDGDGILDVAGFKKKTGMSGRAFYDLAKDLNLAGLVMFSQGKAILKLDMSDTDQDLTVALRNFLRNRFSENHSVFKILMTLKDNKTLTIADIATHLETWSPLIKIKKRTWLIHAQLLGQWMDAADLALLDKMNKTLVHIDPESEIRERELVLPRRRGSKIPRAPYAPIEKIAIRLVQALQGDGIMDWTGFSKNTIFGTLAALEDLEFIKRKTALIKVLPRAKDFFAHPNQRPFLFAEGALQLQSFSEFIEILKSKQTKGSTLLELGHELRKRLGATWTESTSEGIAKTLLDWARHANLAPGAFSKIRKGPIKGWKKKKDYQLSLFKRDL